MLVAGAVLYTAGCLEAPLVSRPATTITPLPVMTITVSQTALRVLWGRKVKVSPQPKYTIALTELKELTHPSKLGLRQKSVAERKPRCQLYFSCKRAQAGASWSPAGPGCSPRPASRPPMVRGDTLPRLVWCGGSRGAAVLSLQAFGSSSNDLLIIHYYLS